MQEIVQVLEERIQELENKISGKVSWWEVIGIMVIFWIISFFN